MGKGKNRKYEIISSNICKYYTCEHINNITKEHKTLSEDTSEDAIIIKDFFVDSIQKK